MAFADAPPSPGSAFHRLLNKIIDVHFIGARMDHVHLVVEADDGLFEYPIDPCANEFITAATLALFNARARLRP